MGLTSKTFRVFVSSTFSDLKAERNALQQYVFPRLRELCMRHGCRFQPIDLRWGVSEEAALDQQTMKICLKEIARCQAVTPRPNFIVLLGDRYGWRPLPAEIPADEFEAIKSNITSEADVATLERYYLLDENAQYRRAADETPVGLYCLQSRKVNGRDGAADQERETARDAESAEWGLVESQLRRILLDAVASLHLKDGGLAKYYASATEQEIMRGAMDVADVEYHVSCFFRSLHSASDRPLSEDLPRNHAVNDFIDLNEDSSFDNNAGDRLRDLKVRLGERLGKNVHQYNAHWLGSGEGSQSPITLDHIGTLAQDLDECLQLIEVEQPPSLLCVDVWRQLARVILKEIAQIERVSPVQREKDEHEKFGAKRAKHFRGRARYLDAIQQYVDATDQHPFALWGESGSGKSALLTRVAEQIHETNPNAKLVVRFIGATPQSSDVRALLESLCHEISGLYETERDTIPADYNKVVKEFPKRLALATEQKPLVLMLDALDQLSDTEHGRNLIWLPTKLPEHVRLIVSTIDGECLDALQLKLPAESILLLEAMPKSEGGEVLDLWLQDASRTLQEGQHLELLNKFAANGLPLYLKLAFEEARLWHSYDGLNSLAADVPGIIRNLFERLSDEANHGAVMVSRSLGYLAASRNGLTEDEILAVLSSDEEVMRAFKRRSPKSPAAHQLPVVVWSRLYFDLAPYLTERSADGTSLLSFYHRQLGEVTAQKYLAGEDKHRAHKHLADYFDGQDYWVETIVQYRNRVGEFPASARRANLRKVVEFPWQLSQLDDWDRLEQIHTNLDFLESKTAAGLAFQLAQDFTEALKIVPPERPLWRLVHLLAEALRRDIHFIARHREDYPQALFQCLWNSCWWYDCPAAAVHYEEKDGPWSRDGAKLYGLLGAWRRQKETEAPKFRWLRSLRPLRIHLVTPQVAIMRGHEDKVTSVSFSRDGRLIVSGSDDGTIRIWDAETGEQLRCIRGIVYHVHSIAISIDGRRIVSGSDLTVQIWDAETGEELRCLKGHNHTVTSVAISSDGRRIVSGSWDKSVRVWDTETGELTQILNTSFVTSVAISADGRLIVSGSDETIRVWNAGTGEELYCLREPSDQVLSVAISADGKVIVGGCKFGTLRVWDGENGAALRCLKGNECSVTSVVISTDGRRIVGALTDATVRVWDLETLEELQCLKGHHDQVISVAISADGHQIVSGSWDNSVRVWDAETRYEVLSLKGHALSVTSVASSGDGRRIASGSFDKTIRVWDAETGEELHMLRVSGDSLIPTGHTDSVSSVALSMDGRLVVSGSGDATVRVWDTETGKELQCLEGHERLIASVAISTDGRRIVSGSWDGSVRVWDAGTGEVLQILSEDFVYKVVISTDGKRIMSSSGNNRVCVWDAETGEVLQILKRTTIPEIPVGQRFLPKKVFKESELVIEDKTGNQVAFFSEALSYVETCPGGLEWAGAISRYLGIIRFEGEVDETALSLDLGCKSFNLGQ